jgi:hypothetical protein
MRSRLMALALLTALMAACGSPDGGPASEPGAQPGGADPESPVGSTPADPGSDGCGTKLYADPGDDTVQSPEGEVPCGKKPGAPFILVKPRPGMADVRPIQWARARVSDDGKTVTVVYWGGVEPCEVLDHVAVEESSDAITITLFSGHDPTEPDTACIELAQKEGVRVTLDEPVGGRKIVDGAKQAEK